MLEIEENGKSVTVSALIDSGNLLSDPLSARPVILVRRRELEPLLPPRLFSLLESDADTALPLSVQRKVRIIPMEGIGGRVTLLGYRPDAILCFRAQRPTQKQALDAVIAICEKELRDFGGHGAILPARIVH